ncbi:MAG: Gfo/Idh/MocA family oxidoreductase [Acidobacteriota bacterium]
MEEIKQQERLQHPLRMGILGTGNIVRDFVHGVRTSNMVTVTTVSSRDHSRASGFAAELGLPAACGSYDELLGLSEIDAIYNPLPNTLHAEWSIRATQAGKHVLCEKPLAATAAEAKAMTEAARDAGVYLVEAYPYRSQPINERLKALLGAGEIGKVKFIRADFGFPMTDETNIRLNPALKGGSLWDAGCYPISLVTMVAQERPGRVQAAATWATSGVDKSVAATLEFDGGLIAQISCASPPRFIVTR